MDGVSFEEPPVYGLHDLRFLRHNLRSVILAPAIAQEGFIVHGHLSVREALSDAPGHVLGDAPGFLLGQAGHDRQQQLPIERLFDTITFCTQKGRFCTLLGAPLIDSAPKA